MANAAAGGGMSEPAEAFLDQFITWRELGYNFSSQREDYDQYDSLPDWAKKTLAKHARDHRPTVYSHDEFAAAATHDPLWNAAQRQLLSEGRLHNYLRMLWGKKILEWSPTPEEALATMIELNNKYAIDGRNPNSYSGIFWILGRFDRPWGPERPIFGTVRYMSSDNTARKFDVRPYLAKYGAPGIRRTSQHQKANLAALRCVQAEMTHHDPDCQDACCRPTALGDVACGARLRSPWRLGDTADILPAPVAGRATSRSFLRRRRERARR